MKVKRRSSFRRKHLEQWLAYCRYSWPPAATALTALVIVLVMAPILHLRKMRLRKTSEVLYVIEIISFVLTCRNRFLYPDTLLMSFSVHKIMSSLSSYISSFPYICFSCLTPLAKTSNTRFNRSSGLAILVSFLILGGSFQYFTIKYDIWCRICVDLESRFLASKPHSYL